VVAQVAGSVFFWFWFFEDQQDSRVLFSLGCGSHQYTRRSFGFIRRSLGKRGFFLLGVTFFGGFLILTLNVIPRQIDRVYCWILLAFLSL
jgi:hypothetical protein